MPEAVIVAAARSPIGRAFKGSLPRSAPDDLLAQMVSAALAKVPALDPALVEDLIVGCGLPGGSRGTTSPGSSRSCSASTPCQGRPSTGTAPPRCSPPGWPITRSRPARATCSSPAASRPLPVRQGGQRLAAGHPEPGVRRRAGPHQGDRRGGERGGTTRAPTADARRLHRDGADRGERGRLRGISRAGAGRVRGQVAEPGREGPRRTASGSGRSCR